MASAEDLGARLLGEVEVVGLDEVSYGVAGRPAWWFDLQGR